MISARISPKGQITLPRRIRQVLNVQAGERVLFVMEEKKVVLRPMMQSSASSLAGSLRRYAGKTRGGKEREFVRKETARAAAKEG